MALNKPTVVFVTFETEFSKYGGLGAVMTQLPDRMIQNNDCILLGPFFKKITDPKKLKSRGAIQDYQTVCSFYIPIRGKSNRVEVTRLTKQLKSKELHTFLVSSPGFFTASSAP